MKPAPTDASSTRLPFFRRPEQSASFNASGIVFPVEGCYRIRGEADGVVLSFVTMVRSCSALAELPPSQRKDYAICG